MAEATIPTRARLASRIREVLTHSRGGVGELTYEPEIAGWPAGSSLPDPDQIATLLHGSIVSRPTSGKAIVIEREYSCDWRHGRYSVRGAAEECRTRHDAMSIVRSAWPGRATEGGSGLAPGPIDGRLLFVDIETTGLNGGAGMFAFLIGCGFFDGDVFRTHQIFLPSFSDEHRLLSEIGGLVEDAGAIVTYNGRAFDVPVMEMRYLFHRRESPFGELPHVDMLHPARRLWKRRHVESTWHFSLDGSPQSCSLTALERSVLGFERINDVPGFEIPGRYFHYLRTRDTRPVEPVLEHNRLDVLSLALLTSVVLRLVSDGSEAAADARECLELGHLFERAGQQDRAVACFRGAVERAGAGDDVDKAEALLALAVMSRRARRYAEAAEYCERVVSLPSSPHALTGQALHILAVHHEHRSKDLRQARGFALKSLHHAEPGRRRDVARRLERLDRKLTGLG